MKYTVTGAQMKQIDRDTIERIGIPSLVLMERAALAVADEVTRRVKAPAPVLAVCGGGNNGADGIAAGRILQSRGYEVTLCMVGNLDHATEENLLQQRIARELGMRFMEAGELRNSIAAGDASVRGTDGFRIIIDAIFGIGLRREVGGSYRELIAALRALAADTAAEVIAVDVPSGINADTGQVMGMALPATVTVTFGWEKTGLLLYPGRSFAGIVRTADIGFFSQSLERIGYDCRMLTDDDLSGIAKRRADGNKGTFGKLLIVAGSAGMSGAAYLSALAAYRCGVGLVRLLTVPENRVVLQTQLPEAIVSVYEPERIGQETDFIEEQCRLADAIVLGPGLGQEPYVETLVEIVLAHAYVPIVLDADALNIISVSSHLTRYFTENIVVTPHIGEMARLTGLTVEEIKADALYTARDFAANNGVVCILKDAATVIADKNGETYVNTSGCSAMAKGGSGDVLSGVIGALLARENAGGAGTDILQLAACGVYLHGRAGERAAAVSGVHGVLAHEIADHLSDEGTDGHGRNER
ncbi:MAG: NAD(P)H-hydrate dehydratase [Clostridiales bacterium]|nr:NAD(P)H-hydrate dehydratase [Clostridiales bacterium]